MVQARWKDMLIAQSDATVIVEGNHYFPPEAIVDPAMLRPSDTTSICPWKGTARYYTLVVNGAENQDAVWYYPDPLPAAAEIKGRLAFWKGVEVG